MQRRTGFTTAHALPQWQVCDLFPLRHRAAMAIMRQQARFIEQLYSTGMVDDQEVTAL